jgi:chromosome segregation ATPase
MPMQPSDYLVIATKIFTVIAEAFEEMDKREAMRAGYDAASELTDTLVYLRERVATLETVQARHDAINDMDGDRLAALETAMNDQRAIRDSIISTLKSLSSRMDSLSQRLDSHDKRMDSLSQRLDHMTRGWILCLNARV